MLSALFTKIPILPHEELSLVLAWFGFVPLVVIREEYSQSLGIVDCFKRFYFFSQASTMRIHFIAREAAHRWVIMAKYYLQSQLISFL